MRTRRRALGRTVAIGAPLALVLLSALAVQASLWKLLGIAWIAFAAMAVGGLLGSRASPFDDAGTETARRLVWGYGLASGAMITSAALFLLPGAIGHDGSIGGLGVAAGVLAGFASHTLGHRLSHADPFDDTVLALTAHSLAAGAVIGVVYAALPSLGPLLGVAIVSHKGPAGYAAARRLAGADRSSIGLLVPSAGVGLTAIPAGLAPVPTDPVVNAAIFGFAAGVFLHVAMDFLPRCEVGEEIHAVAGEDHAFLDRLRLHAAGSTAIGAVAIVAAWQVIG